MAEINTKKRKFTNPPDGYVCSLCGIAGHWIQQCKLKNKKNKKKNASHIHIPGKDPSQSDIDRAKELQKIRPPNCFCGSPSRLKKVKRSSQGENSRAIGHYFFFCNKQKRDDSKCKFARPVDDVVKPAKERVCSFFAKNGSCKKGDKCKFSHDLSLVNAQTPKGRNDNKEKESNVEADSSKDVSEKSEKDEQDLTESSGSSSDSSDSSSDSSDSSDSE